MEQQAVGNFLNVFVAFGVPIVVVAVLQSVDVDECQGVGGSHFPGCIGVAVEGRAVAHAGKEVGVGVALKLVVAFTQLFNAVLKLRQVFVGRAELQRVVVIVDRLCDGGGNGEVGADATERCGKRVPFLGIFPVWGVEHALGELFSLMAFIDDELAQFQGLSS